MLISYKYQTIRPGSNSYMFLSKPPTCPKKLFEEIASSTESLYEHILPDTDEIIKQKPRFDIDMNEGHGIDDTDAYCSEVIKAAHHILRNEYRMKTVYCESFYVFSSHDYSDHPYPKRSYHIIIDGVHHNSSREAKAFYYQVVSRLQDAKYVDSAVYKSGQLFRLMGCSKLDSDRVKCPILSFKMGNITIEHTEDMYDIFKASLITYCESSFHIPIILQERVKSVLTHNEDDPMVQGIFTIINDIHGKTIKFHYIKEGLIVFRNVYGVDCSLCGRLHTMENPFVIVKRWMSGVFQVLFNCRRSGSSVSHIIGFTTIWGQSLTILAGNGDVIDIQHAIAVRFDDMAKAAMTAISSIKEDCSIKTDVSEQEIDALMNEERTTNITIPISSKPINAPKKSTFNITSFTVCRDVIKATIEEIWDDKQVIYPNVVVSDDGKRPTKRLVQEALKCKKVQ